MRANVRETVTRAFRRTPAMVARTANRWDGFAILLGSSVGYLLIYLWAIGNLALHTGSDLAVEFVDRPLTRMTETAPGAFSFEPIAIVEFGFGTYLFSPLNTALGAVLAGLVGVNMVLSYLAITQPRACGIRSGTGVLAAIPALVAGSACCAPLIFLVLGIMATGTMLTLLPLLLPIGIVLLVVSLIYLSAQIDPSALAHR